jgi:cell fate (sporulation/competence/biofilm development) regulator YlbF (YheA/YmcA/DUF963 family)
MIAEKATDLGRVIGQSAEFQAFKRASERLRDDPELRGEIERLRNLELTLTEQLERGQEPDSQQKAEHESILGRVQQHQSYQGLIAAQSNYDKLMQRVQQWIADGISKGSESRIITLG